MNDSQTSIAVFDSLARLAPFDIDIPKLRIGGSSDGGYILADRLRGQDLISFGIGNEISFETELAQHGHRCFMFDHTIDRLPQTQENFRFERLGLCSVGERKPGMRSLQAHLEKLDGTAKLSERLLLKIDIEGDEWDAFADMSDDTLIRFDQVVGEFHGLLNLGNRAYRETFDTVLSRLNGHFTLFHVHANNAGRFGVVEDFPITNVMELSFIRTSLVTGRPSQTVYPTPLDRPNLPSRPDRPLLFFPFLPMPDGPGPVREALVRALSSAGAARAPSGN